MPLLPMARVRLDVGPADVGRRLTVRYREDGLGRGAEQEMVGVLVRWSGGLRDGILRLRRRDGIEHGIRVDDLVAARVVPPEMSAYAVQRMCQQGWPPLEEESRGNWTLRASRGATGRANSVRVAGAPRGSLSAALDAVREWYADRGLLPRLQIPRPCGLGHTLSEAGWTQRRASRVLVASTPRLLTSTGEARERTDLEISVESAPNPQFLSLVPGYDDKTAPEFEHAFAAVQPAAYVYCRNSQGELLGIGHAVLQDIWCGVTTIQTLPQSRRSGIATAVTARLAQWAHEQRAESWYLQLFEDNAAALGFYENLGFVTHHRYEYRWPTAVPPESLWAEADNAADPTVSPRQ